MGGEEGNRPRNGHHFRREPSALVYMFGPQPKALLASKREEAIARN